MRDIRDPEIIGDEILKRPKGKTVLQAADELELPGVMVRNFGESGEHFLRRPNPVDNGSKPQGE